MWYCCGAVVAQHRRGSIEQQVCAAHICVTPYALPRVDSRKGDCMCVHSSGDPSPGTNDVRNGGKAGVDANADDSAFMMDDAFALGNGHSSCPAVCVRVEV